MNNIIKKIASFYDLSQVKHTYQFEYNLNVFCCVLINLIGCAFILAPLYFSVRILSTLSINDIQSLSSDSFAGLCLIVFFVCGISSGFFLHNKHKISMYLQITAFSSIGLSLVVGLAQLAYYFVFYNIKMISNPSEYEPIVYLDLAIIPIAAVVFLVSNEKVQNALKNFMNKRFAKYQE